MRKIMLSSLLFAIVMAATVIPLRTPSALAADDAPCGPPFQHGGLAVQTCPLWRGDAPVYQFQNGAPVGEAGRLVEGGSANWFVCQFQFVNQPYSLGSYTTNWWAYTMADNGQWGWVPEVYFSGGGNFEADAGLAPCFAG
jgi:hypothetical protein